MAMKATDGRKQRAPRKRARQPDEVPPEIEQDPAAEPPRVDALAVAQQYARGIVGGRIPSPKTVRQACERFLADLGRQGERGWVFDAEAAQHAVDFAHSCRYIKTDVAAGYVQGQCITLQPWQIFILVNLFGWYNADGTRRFKTAYIEVPRKNGKSTLLAIVALYLASADGEARARVYTVATTFDQAREVWDIAKAMVEESEAMGEEFDLYARSMVHTPSRSLCAPLHAKQKSNEGKDIHGAIVDELHAHPDNKMWTVIKYGTGARRNSLVVAITTAGDDPTGVCYEQREYVVRILAGVAEAPHYFGIIWSPDKEDESRWDQEDVWRKVNPNWGVSVVPQVMRNDCLEAIGNPTMRSEFQRKRVGIWVGADDGYYDLAEWRACAAPKRKRAEYEELPVFGGIDAARLRDLLAVIWWYAEALEGERQIRLRAPGDSVEDTEADDAPMVTIPEYRFHQETWLYLPGVALNDIKNKNNWRYRDWHERGILRVTEGNAIDYLQVKRDILAFKENHNVVSMGFDERYMHQLAQELEGEGLEMVQVVQNAQTLNLPMQEIDVLMRDRKITHDDNECFAWMLANVVGYKPGRAAPKLLQPGKKEGQEYNKIDGPVAAMMAWHVCMLGGSGIHIPEGYEIATVSL